MPFVGATPVEKPPFPLWIERAATRGDIPSQGSRREVRGRPPIARWYRGSSLREVSDRPWSVGGTDPDPLTVEGDETWIHVETSDTVATVSHIGGVSGSAGAITGDSWISVTVTPIAFDTHGHYASDGGGTVTHSGPGAKASTPYVDLCTVSGRYIHLQIDAKGHVVGFTISSSPP